MCEKALNGLISDKTKNNQISWTKLSDGSWFQIKYRSTKFVIYLYFMSFIANRIKLSISVLLCEALRYMYVNYLFFYFSQYTLWLKLWAIFLSSHTHNWLMVVNISIYLCILLQADNIGDTLLIYECLLDFFFYFNSLVSYSPVYRFVYSVFGWMFQLSVRHWVMCTRLSFFVLLCSRVLKKFLIFKLNRVTN